MSPQSMHGIRVQLATTKLACKNCGHEYAPADLASLSVCESCGIALLPDGIAGETRQRVIVESDDAKSKSSDATIDSSENFGARISVKRFEIKDCPNKYRACAMDAPACQPASWIKVG
ncbi:MAG TPA: hypothetical protein VKM55_06650 [Candidatus Lokiarchaeia archaeon]|nr:hypothetical protein [Candidatus Lokiarchaeia archaeon]